MLNRTNRRPFQKVECDRFNVEFECTDQRCDLLVFGELGNQMSLPLKTMGQSLTTQSIPLNGFCNHYFVNRFRNGG